jgi:lysophospholipase L1-like esterase
VIIGTRKPKLMPNSIRLLCALLSAILLTSTPAQSRENVGRILVIGDSLTVGGFGETLQELLVTRYGTENVFVYGSCGSAPQHWLTVEPPHVTKCGFRQRTPQRTLVLDYKNGQRPPPVQTPKIDRLLWQHKPQVVIVQLGTNWFDDLLGRNSDEEIKKMAQALDRFANSLRGKQIIWVTPPDSTKFSKAVQDVVRKLIWRAAKTWHFDLIDSSQLTHYVNGRSGSDGVHYNSEAGADWARRVMKQLQSKIHNDSGPRVFFSDENG